MSRQLPNPDSHCPILMPQRIRSGVHLPNPLQSTGSSGILQALEKDQATRQPARQRKTTPPVIKGYVPPDQRPLPPVMNATAPLGQAVSSIGSAASGGIGTGTNDKMDKKGFEEVFGVSVGLAKLEENGWLAAQTQAGGGMAVGWDGWTGSGPGSAPGSGMGYDQPIIYGIAQPTYQLDYTYTGSSSSGVGIAHTSYPYPPSRPRSFPASASAQPDAYYIPPPLQPPQLPQSGAYLYSNHQYNLQLGIPQPFFVQWDQLYLPPSQAPVLPGPAPGSFSFPASTQAPTVLHAIVPTQTAPPLPQHPPPSTLRPSQRTSSTKRHRVPTPIYIPSQSQPFPPAQYVHQPPTPATGLTDTTFCLTAALTHPGSGSASGFGMPALSYGGFAQVPTQRQEQQQQQQQLPPPPPHTPSLLTPPEPSFNFPAAYPTAPSEQSRQHPQPQHSQAHTGGQQSQPLTSSFDFETFFSLDSTSAPAFGDIGAGMGMGSVNTAEAVLQGVPYPIAISIPDRGQGQAQGQAISYPSYPITLWADVDGGVPDLIPSPGDEGFFGPDGIAGSGSGGGDGGGQRGLSSAVNGGMDAIFGAAYPAGTVVSQGNGMTVDPAHIALSSTSAPATAAPGPHKTTGQGRTANPGPGLALRASYLLSPSAYPRLAMSEGCDPYSIPPGPLSDPAIGLPPHSAGLASTLPPSSASNSNPGRYHSDPLPSPPPIPRELFSPPPTASSVTLSSKKPKSNPKAIYTFPKEYAYADLIEPLAPPLKSRYGRSKSRRVSTAAAAVVDVAGGGGGGEAGGRRSSGAGVLERFGCDECEDTFSRPSDMERHKARKHVPYEKWVYVCELCNERFSRKDHLILHAKRIRCPAMTKPDGTSGGTPFKRRSSAPYSARSDSYRSPGAP
ncbi:uncharacterized protein MKK02DRAFT_41782 [Dioszegia hungarica]|uniref:C2H2-type domain-containing protein n=1 Tax=Dioszegia hungarica TaxID=4972 RepID=A0AA38HGA0_9TREE|nr:uncharacterized protein MKK02DRAFT_41782 [Dioszegia hungarica]KAI9638756.1 hypothetical protein MKK02DRAFT_41782 [Dioszegia hungarica]